MPQVGGDHGLSPLYPLWLPQNISWELPHQPGTSQCTTFPLLWQEETDMFSCILYYLISSPSQKIGEAATTLIKVPGEVCMEMKALVGE